MLCDKGAYSEQGDREMATAGVSPGLLAGVSTEPVNALMGQRVFTVHEIQKSGPSAFCTGRFKS